MPVDPNAYSSSFPYESTFEKIIERKKIDKSYRYFRNVNRLAQEFPYAHSGEKKIDVWCTNDYASLSRCL